MGYCKRGELDWIKSLICLCMLAPAITTADSEDRRAKGKSFEKDIVVGGYQVQGASETSRIVEQKQLKECERA